MPSIAHRGRRSPSGATGFIPVLLANLIPLVGVLLLGWDPATLAAVYVIEAVLSIPLAGATALFAARPPAGDREPGVISVTKTPLASKRGAFRPVSWLPPVYPRNLPFAAAVCGATAWIALFVGVTFSQAFDVPTLLGRPTVLASALALLAGQAVEAARDYLGRQRYAETSPYAVVETPTRRGVFLLFVLFALPPLHAAGGGVAVLAAFVAAKLVVEWSAFRTAHGDDAGGGGRLTDWLAGPTESPEDPEPIAVPDAEPDVRIPVHRRTAVATAVLKTLVGVAPIYATGFLVAWIAAFGLFVGGDPSGAVVRWSAVALFALFLGALAVNAAGFALTYAPIEYRRYGDRLVAYDAWLDEPQWVASVDRLRGASVVHTRLPDRMFGARTVGLTAGVGDDETERFVGPVADGEALASAFDLPVRSTDLPAMDRPIAAVAVAVGLALAAGAVALIAGPWGSSADVVRVFFLLPFAVWSVRWLWRQAYDEPE
ncbi:DUF6498-containing protein [Halorubrum kocurii]|uniref:Uncharacterized protein n=1 Tax=Halorubrum kocurii JCM 14978 TaxID=1230456 RepID=M0P4W3_9EURY|nr:DUF6498-containing protein [Halorubrum kocurii]EMA64569.1 hypothetical protein C468_08529 [Halorubrum kocurii JCM 14978]